MKKSALLFAVICCFLSFTVLSANDSDFDESLTAAEVTNTDNASKSDSSTVKSDEKASEESKTKTEEAKEEKEKQEEEKNEGMATLPNGPA